MNRSLALSAAALVSLTSLAGCGVAPAPTGSGGASAGCQPTQAAPPAAIPSVVADFMISGIMMPAGITPPPLTGMHGNDAIWVDIGTSDGRLVGVAEPGGRLGAKFGTFRLVDGALTVTAERLDGPSSDVTVSVPDGYGRTGFQSMAIDFPSAGCWRVSEQVAGKGAVFVVAVTAPGP